MNRQISWVVRIVYLSTFLLINLVAEEPEIDYSKSNPYPPISTTIVLEMTVDDVDPDTCHYFWSGRQRDLKNILRILEVTATYIEDGKRKQRDVVIVYDANVVEKHLKNFREILSKGGIEKPRFIKRKGLRKELSAYIKRRVAELPVVIVDKTKKQSAVEKDFNAISQTILSLQQPLDESSEEVIDQLIEDCQTLLKKHIDAKNDPFYKLAERRLQKLIRLRDVKPKKE